jgi:hypothetical protein
MLKGINPEQIYWLFEFGRPKRQISADALKQHLHLIDRPVFFLSTGRTGTLWLSKLFSHSPGVKSYHAPAPDLSAQNCFAYEIQKKGSIDQQEITDILGHIFLAGREQVLRYSYKCRRRYLETNNHITFFAPVIATLLPQSLFVHVYRHPGDFVSSGLKRGWYENDASRFRQIRPVDTATREDWSAYTSLQKIAWLWKETNAYIENFKQGMPADRVFSLDFSNMDPGSLREMAQFADIPLSKARISKRLHHRLNDQRFSREELYLQWPDQDRESLSAICQSLASHYGYSL